MYLTISKNATAYTNPKIHRTQSYTKMSIAYLGSMRPGMSASAGDRHSETLSPHSLNQSSFSHFDKTYSHHI